MILQTPRLTLRELTLDDADCDFLVTLLNDPAFVKNIGDRGVRTREDARSYLSKNYVPGYRKFGFGMWLAVETANKNPAGVCGLLKRDSLDDIDVGFAFLPAFLGKGYAVESAKASLGYAKKTLGVKRVVAITAAENLRSMRVLEKIGMHFEREVRLDPQSSELKLYAIEF